MSRWLCSWLFIVLFVTVPFASRFVAQEPPPVIYSATFAGSEPTLSIRGANLPAGANVLLGEQLLDVIAEGTGDFIDADLPDGLMPGSYLLRVAAAGSTNVATFIVGVGLTSAPSGDASLPARSFTASPGTGDFLATDHTATVAENQTVIQSFGENLAGTYSPLVEIRTRQSLTASGTQAGRGAVRLYDRVGFGNRKLELGFYEYGGGLFFTGGSGFDPFEFWIESGIFSVKGNDRPGIHNNRIEVRTPSDANGVNITSGRYRNQPTGLFGGHVTQELAGYPLFMRVEDGTGFGVFPNSSFEIGGRLLPASAPAPTVTIRAGDVGASANLAFGRYDRNGQFDSTLWRLRMEPDGRSFGLFYGWGAVQDVKKGILMTDDGRTGFGSDRANTVAKMQITSNETSIPTMLLEAANNQTGDLQQWKSAGSIVARVTATGNVGLGVASPTSRLSVSGTTDATAYRVGGVAGATCTGLPTAGFRVTNGIITSC